MKQKNYEYFFGIADFLIKINKLLATICFLIGILLLVISLIEDYTAVAFTFLTYSSILLILLGPKYFIIPFIQVSIKICGRMLYNFGLPQFLAKHSNVSILLSIFAVLLLWLPSVLLSEFIAIIILWTVWTILFRSLQEAEYLAILTQEKPSKTQEQKEFLFWFFWLLILIFCIICCLLPLISFSANFLKKGIANFNEYQTFTLIVSIIFLCFTLYIGFFYQRNAKRTRAALETLQLQHQLEQNQLYIDLLTQKYQTLRQYQHDFKKHLAYIQQLARQNETSMIDTYIGTVYDDLQSGPLLKLTGNQTLDLLLSDKLQQAKKQAIAFEIDYQPNVNLSCIKALDLCIILGNLLDNALAAAAQSTERRIDCSFQQKNEYYSTIAICNSCDTAPVMKGGIPQRQTPSEQRGYGVENVINRAQKYGGHCQFVYDPVKKQFQATVLLGGETSSVPAVTVNKRPLLK